MGTLAIKKKPIVEVKEEKTKNKFLSTTKEVKETKATVKLSTEVKTTKMSDKLIAELSDVVKKHDTASKQLDSFSNKIEEELFELQQKVEAKRAELEKKYGLDKVQKNYDLIETEKNKLCASVLDLVKTGQVHPSLSITDKIGKRTPKYMELCEKFIPNLEDLKKLDEWNSQKVTKKLIFNGVEVFSKDEK